MIRRDRDSIDTRAVHAGREDFPRLGVHAPPLDLSSTYPLPDLDLAITSMDELAAGAAPPRAASSSMLVIARSRSGSG